MRADGIRIDPDVAGVLAECRRRDARSLVLSLALSAVFVGAFAVSGGFEIGRYADAVPTVLQLLADAAPPDFGAAASWLRPLQETLAMSVAATLIGTFLALPLALMGARNTGLPRPLSAAARLVLSASRSVPELVFGIVFVAAVGFGPLAGVLALSCHSVGMLGKFLAEHLEHLDPGPADALKSHGVSRAGIVRYCLVPQVMPRLVDVALYRWEHNVRAASVMGMIGAGGLGRELVVAFSLFEYREAAALLILILAVVSLIDLLSYRLRKSLVERS